MNLVERFKEEDGQALVEYALLFVLVVLLLIILVALFGKEVRDAYCRVILTFDVWNIWHVDPAEYSARCPDGLTPLVPLP